MLRWPTAARRITPRSPTARRIMLRWPNAGRARGHRRLEGLGLTLARGLASLLTQRELHHQLREGLAQPMEDRCGLPTSRLGLN